MALRAPRKRRTKKPFELKSYLIGVLRKKSLYYPERSRALSMARVDRGLYKCASCEGIFGPRKVHVDHIASVVDVASGFVDWNTYIARLFVPAEQLQILCISCHESKSETENNLRRINRIQKNSTKK